MNYSHAISELLEDQKKEWPLLKQNYEALKKVRHRSFSFNSFSLTLQFNPERIVSSAAKVDKKSISERKCFLCSENRPKEQNSVNFDSDLEILCNPFPIFQEHFTISHKQHVVQEIGSYFGQMLDVSRALQGMVVFYNAPDCGASAPDHMHFQAGNSGFLTIEKDFSEYRAQYGENILENDNISINAVDDGLRRSLVLESDSRDILSDSFEKIFHQASEFKDGNEPMLNILAYYQDQWRILVFPREKHRPWQYFEKGEKNILLSPASVDMGGCLITPLEKDFLKITKEDITDIFQQLTISTEKFNTYKSLFAKKR